MTIAIYHNILWSSYKGLVFSELWRLASCPIEFVQIAETDSQRKSLTAVQKDVHAYPYRLMFPGAGDEVPLRRKLRSLFLSVWRTKASVVVLPGYHLPEYWAMLVAAILRRKRRAVFSDSTIFDQRQTFIKGLLKRAFFSQCHAFFTYGARGRQHLMHYGVPPRKIVNRCQAAALPASYSLENVSSERRHRNLDPKSPRLLYVGRLSHEKGLPTLLAAFQSLQRSRPGARLRIVGSGPIRDALKPSEGIELVGAKDTEGLGRDYLWADALVLPSTSEPWGLVVNEALAHGCPVVVSNVCGCVPELVLPSITGFSFPVGNTDRLLDATERLLLLIEQRGSAAVADGCLDVIRDYTPRRAALEILQGCSQLLGREISQGS